MQPSTKIDLLNDPTPRQSPKPVHAPLPSSRSLHQYRQPAAELFRVFQTWPPDFIGFAAPTIVCLIIGPRAVLLRFARLMRREQNGGDLAQPSIQEDLLVLILRHFAHYWNIGIFLLGKSHLLPSSSAAQVLGGGTQADFSASVRFCACV